MAEKYVNATIRAKIPGEGIVKIYPTTTADQIIITSDINTSNVDTNEKDDND